MRLVTPQQMRRLEELSDQNGVSYAQLMEHAGQQLSIFLLRKILFLCGNGNNGGDCFVAARLLSSQGVPVSVGLLCGIPKTILAYSMYKQLGDIPVLSSIAQIKEAIGIADFVVDGVFGTGFHGTLRPEQAELFALASSRFCIGVDIPSGGNAETGAVVHALPDDGILRSMQIRHGAVSVENLLRGDPGGRYRHSGVCISADRLSDGRDHGADDRQFSALPPAGFP